MSLSGTGANTPETLASCVLGIDEYMDNAAANIEFSDFVGIKKKSQWDILKTQSIHTGLLSK